MHIALIAFTASGRRLAERVRAVRPDDVFSVFDRSGPTSAWVEEAFRKADALIFIGATGIAVRLSAPHLRSKGCDPAVLVMDEKGRHVIPLLSGHIGGANRLAVDMANALGAVPVITTATDLNGVFAVDVWAAANDCAIPDLSRIKHVSGALLAGCQVGFRSDFPTVGELPTGLEQDEGDSVRHDVGICVSLHAGQSPWMQTLHLVPRVVVLGAGCRKGVEPEKFAAFVAELLMRERIAPQAVRLLCSIDLKREEPCFLDFAAVHNVAFRTFSAEDLRAVPGTFSSSDFVSATTGVDNVCERAALAGLAGKKGRLILSRTSRDGMTLAAAVQDWTCVWSNDSQQAGKNS